MWRYLGIDIKVPTLTFTLTKLKCIKWHWNWQLYTTALLSKMWWSLMGGSVNTLTKRAGNFSPDFIFILYVICWIFNQKETLLSPKTLNSQSNQSPQSLFWTTAMDIPPQWLPGTGTCWRVSFSCKFSSVICWQALAASWEVYLTPSHRDTVLQQTVPKRVTRESARSTSASHP